METIWKLADGHKTQIAAIAGTVLAWVQARGWVSGDTAMMLAGVLTALTGVGVGHAAMKAKQGA